MADTTGSPDSVAAHVRVIRLTDKMLALAEELREARQRLQQAADSTPARRQQEGQP